MNAIIQEILKSPSLSTLPLRVEEGYLPALITQVTGAMRALAAAVLRRATGRPLAVICPDDAAAATMCADLEALLGQRPVEEAVVSAAWIHAAAGDACAAEKGEYGMTPTDMIEMLPYVMKELTK